MDIVKEKKFIKNVIFKITVADEELRPNCSYSNLYEFEFYSMYGAVVRDLWERTWRSFDSWDKFLDYCNDCKNEALYLYKVKNQIISSNVAFNDLNNEQKESVMAMIEEDKNCD